MKNSTITGDLTFITINVLEYKQNNTSLMINSRMDVDLNIS